MENNFEALRKKVDDHESRIAQIERRSSKITLQEQRVPDAARKLARIKHLGWYKDGEIRVHVNGYDQRDCFNEAEDLLFGEIKRLLDVEADL